MNTILTNILKQIIQSEGLVSSGKMLNETEVDLMINERFKIDVKVNSTPYFYYLDEQYGLVKKMLKNKDAISEIKLNIKKALLQKLNK